MKLTIFSNIPLKLTALVLAVVAYIYIGSELRESPGTLPTAITKDYNAKIVPVRVDLLGKPHRGFEVNENQIVVKPEKVMIIGPRILIESLDYLETQPIYIGKKAGSLRATVPLKIVGPYQGMDQQMIEVLIPIERSAKK